jgi:hypothetical protein
LRLGIIDSTKIARVLPVHMLDYMAFREAFGSQTDETELHMLEKFHAARSMVQRGFQDTFVSATLRTIPRTDRVLDVDVCGIDHGNLDLVFCETDPVSESLFERLGLVEDAENASAILLFPSRIDTSEVSERFPEAIQSGKFKVQQLPWRERAIDRTFREALEIMDLLGNETRVRMLVPLLEKPYGKRQYRTEINPKLVYENVTSLLTHRLIDELEDDTYGLSRTGRQIFCEYMAFVERVRRVLEENRE